MKGTVPKLLKHEQLPLFVLIFGIYIFLQLSTFVSLTYTKVLALTIDDQPICAESSFGAIFYPVDNRGNRAIVSAIGEKDLIESYDYNDGMNQFYNGLLWNKDLSKPMEIVPAGQAKVTATEVFGVVNSSMEEAMNVNKKGEVVGSSNGRAFLWTKEKGMVSLRHFLLGLNAISGGAVDINEKFAIDSRKLY